MVLEKTLESLLDCKEIQPVHPKGDQSWVFIGRSGVEAETPILWPPDAKSWLIWKDPDAGKYWEQEERGMTEDGMAGGHHRLNGHEFGWTPGVGDGQGGLVCCSSWGRKELDMTEWLNWTELKGKSSWPQKPPDVKTLEGQPVLSFRKKYPASKPPAYIWGKPYSCMLNCVHPKFISRNPTP